MKFLPILLTILLVSCQTHGDLFRKAHKAGCVTVKDVHVGSQNLGTMVLCTEKEFELRVK